MRGIRFKVVVIGDSGVGKTTIVKRFLGEPFSEIYIKTLGVDFYSKSEIYNFKGVGKVKIFWDIHDFGGQPTFSSIRRLAYFGAHAGIVVFDVSNVQSFKNLKYWLEEFVTFCGVRPILLVGNKIDLREKVITLSPKVGEKFASMLSESFGIEVPYLETSAKLGINVNKAFKTLAQSLFRFRVTKELILQEARANQS